MRRPDWRPDWYQELDTVVRRRWTPIPDDDVLAIWKCSDCLSIVRIPPSYYQECGTLMCCDVDMDYLGTIIRKKRKKRKSP